MDVFGLEIVWVFFFKKCERKRENEKKGLSFPFVYKRIHNKIKCLHVVVVCAAVCFFLGKKVWYICSCSSQYT